MHTVSCLASVSVALLLEDAASERKRHPGKSRRPGLGEERFGSSGEVPASAFMLPVWQAKLHPLSASRRPRIRAIDGMIPLRSNNSRAAWFAARASPARPAAASTLPRTSCASPIMLM